LTSEVTLETVCVPSEDVVARVIEGEFGSPPAEIEADVLGLAAEMAERGILEARG
jgi:hypothetical protein